MLPTSAEKYISLIADTHLETFKHSLDERLEAFKGLTSTQEAANQLRFSQRLAHRAQQLSEFYWPIYIRLQSDNAVWERVLGSQNPNRLPDEIRHPMESFILDNHREILKIIQTKFYLAEPNPDLENSILSYVKHITVYFAMRTSKSHDSKVPLDLGEPWPQDLFPKFKEQLDAVQADYDRMIKSTR